MWTVLTRIGLALAALVVWLGLIAATVALTLQGTIGGLLALVLIMLTMAYIVLVPVVVAWPGGVEDFGWSPGVLFRVSVASGVVVAILGFVTSVGFDRWYLNHYGVDTSARVVEAECYDPIRAGVCEQHLRVAAVTTGADLGWVGCNGTGYWQVGDPIQVRSDPRDLVRPWVSNCPPEGYLDTLVPLTLILAIVTVTTAAATPIYRPLPAPLEGHVEEHVEELAEERVDTSVDTSVEAPVDTPGWRPPVDR